MTLRSHSFVALKCYKCINYSAFISCKQVFYITDIKDLNLVFFFARKSLRICNLYLFIVVTLLLILYAIFFERNQLCKLQMTRYHILLHGVWPPLPPLVHLRPQDIKYIVHHDQQITCRLEIIYLVSLYFIWTLYFFEQCLLSSLHLLYVCWMTIIHIICFERKSIFQNNKLEIGFVYLEL